jgi:hypothetical protein
MFKSISQNYKILINNDFKKIKKKTDDYIRFVTSKFIHTIAVSKFGRTKIE